MRNGKLLLTGLIVLAFAGWGVSQVYGPDEGGLPPLNVESVEQGDVRQQIIAHGTLQPVQKVTVGSQVSGNIEQIMVDFNSPVEQGQVIAQIDPSGFEAEVSSAEAELEYAEAALELAQHQWQRVQQLREQQFVSPSDVDEARSGLRQAQAQVSVRRHALDRARLELNRSTIYSPTDGIVISRNVDVGQTVAASLSAPDLFEIATDLRQMHIYANVSEADIGQVHDGQQVIFLVDGHRDRTFSGEVIQVRNSPIIEDNVVHYETIVLVDNSERLLKPGMTAEVSIITDERDDVLRLRNNALRARLPDQLLPDGHDEDLEEGHQRVYLIRNGELIAGSARTGLSDGVYTEILDGLALGDTLVVGLSLSAGNNGSGGSLFRGSQEQF